MFSKRIIFRYIVILFLLHIQFYMEIKISFYIVRIVIKGEILVRMNTMYRSAVPSKHPTSIQLIRLLYTPLVICSLIKNKWEAEIISRRPSTYYDQLQSISRKYLSACETGKQFHFSSSPMLGFASIANIDL